jgi:hypothetical protein
VLLDFRPTNQAKHAKTRPKFSVRKVAAQLEFTLEARTFAKKAPQTYARLGRETALPNQLLLVAVLVVAGENFEQVVFAVLLGEEKPGPVCPEFPRSEQSVDRAVSLGHVQPGRLVIFIRRHTIQAKRNESSHDVSVRMLAVQFVSPDRIELVQLIVQPIAAIFGN